MFTQESKKSLLTNKEFAWYVDANIVCVYKVNTAPMNDYGRNGAKDGNWSRYGAVADLDAATEDMTLKKDRSFTFVLDTLDMMETKRQVESAKALARQVREVVIPEVDTYTYGVMCKDAGIKPEAVELTKENVYEEILKASKALDDELVPETGRVLLVTPETYRLMKLNTEIIMDTEVGAAERKKGVIGMLDGALVVKVASSRLPVKFGFMLAHPSATVAPTKLEQYKTHENPPGISGELVEGRIVYDAFVLDNKAKGIYYQAVV
jgi:hypothetical protein